MLLANGCRTTIKRRVKYYSYYVFGPAQDIQGPYITSLKLHVHTTLV